MELKILRKKIDKIDKNILSLLNHRLLEVIKINEIKQKENIRAYSPEREETMLSRLKKINKGPFGMDDIESVFREILSVCRSQGASFRIVYLGPQGTFTHLAAIKKFGSKPAYIPADSIDDVFDKVERGEADYGVVPIENSTEGVVNYTLDMFFVSNLKICAEVTLNISHALLGTSLKDIQRIYSNPQVFPQCRKWISSNLKNAELIPVSSTARAAIEARKNSHSVCIGNKVLANIYGLKILVPSIEDTHNNYTRFLVIAKKDSAPSGNDKTSILFSVKDKIGALYEALSYFKKYGANLTKIESRPSKRKPWEYYFFVDVEGHKSSPFLKKALQRLNNKCNFLRILGSYPKDS